MGVNQILALIPTVRLALDRCIEKVEADAAISHVVGEVRPLDVVRLAEVRLHTGPIAVGESRSTDLHPA